MTPSINRRTFLGSTIFIPGIVPRLMAQDARGAGMSAPVQTTAGRVWGTGSLWSESVLRRVVCRLDCRLESLYASGEARIVDSCSRLL